MQMLTEEQKKLLKEKFDSDKEWSTEMVKELSQQLNLSAFKIEKWHYD